MNVPESVSLFISFCEKCVPVGLTILLQTTIIIAGGLFIRRLLRNSNAAFQSTVLRATLVLVILSPLVSVLYVHYGISRIRVPVPAVTETITLKESGRFNTSVETTGEKDSFYPRSSVSEPEKEAPRTSPENQGKVSQNLQPHLQNKALPDNERSTLANRNAHVPQNIGLTPRVISDKNGGFPIQFPRTTKDLITVLYCILITSWIVSSAYYLLKTIIVTLCIIYIRHTGIPAKEHYRRVCEETASMLGMRVPSIIQHPVVRGTFVCGYIKPAIVLPYGKKERLMATREVVLHEYAHLARHDTLWNLVCQFALILIPVQPFISTLLKKVNEVNDYACDDYVLAFGGCRRSYATQLFNISKTYNAGIPEAAVSSGILSSTSPLYDRIERILDASYIGIIKVRAFEIISVVIFSFSSLTLTGFVGFRGESLNGKRLPLQPERQYIERIIAHVPEYVPGQSILTSDKPFKAQQHVENRPDMLHKNGKSKDINMKTAVAGAIDSQINSVSDVTHTSSVVQLPPLAEDEKGIEIPDLKKEPVTATEYIADNTLQTAEGNKTTEQSIVNSEDSLQPERDTTTVFIDDSTASIGTSFAQHNTFELTGSPSISSGEIDALALKTLDIVISYDFENADLTNPEEKLIYEMYRSLENNKLYPVWSPDGNFIVITDREYGIWKVPVNGGEPELVFMNEPVSFRDLSLRLTGIEPLCFAPGGRILTYKRYVIDEDMGTEVTINNSTSPPHVTIMKPVPVIETLDIETGMTQVIAKGAAYGRWSYDGSLFMYSRLDTDSYKELMIRNVLTGQEYPIDEFEAHRILLSPNDRYLMFSKDDLFMIPGTGGLSRFILTGDVTFSDVSRDARWILYTYQKSLYVYDTHNEEATELFPGGNISPSWARFSPDLKDICFSLKTEENNWEIKLYDFSTITGLSDVEEETVPQAFELKKNYPNPFNASTTLQFTLPDRENVSMMIYNVMGQRIRELISGELEPGMHTIVWDSHDDSGRSVGTGTYIAQLTAGNYRTSIRMSLVK